MAKSTEENKSAVSRLAELLNSLPADGAAAKAEEPEQKAGRLRESAGEGISEQDILQQLLADNRDDPEIRRRLQQDFKKNGGKLD